MGRWRGGEGGVIGGDGSEGEVEDGSLLH